MADTPQTLALVTNALAQKFRDRIVKQLLKPDSLGVGHSALEVVERLAVVDVGQMHGVTRGLEPVGEGDDAAGESLRVMEEHDLCHGSHRTLDA